MGEENSDHLLESVLSRLQTVHVYAVLGSNAALIHLERATEVITPLEILATQDPQIPGTIWTAESPLASLFPDTILTAAEEKPIFYQGSTYRIRVAKAEHLIALDLARRGKIATDAFELMHAKKYSDSEEVRCLLKVCSNYENLYKIFTQAFYESR